METAIKSYNSETKENLTSIKPNWKPKWLLEDRHGCQSGITVDDHCFVVLCRDWQGSWRPSSHITNDMARFLGELIEKGLTVAGSRMVGK